MLEIKSLKTVTLSVVAAFIVGCSNSDTTTQESATVSPDGTNIVGSVVKGPISDARVEIRDASGELLATTQSDEGLFSFAEMELESAYYIVESIGGSYDDEATGTFVSLVREQGLKTLLTREELQAIVDESAYLAMTPETTIYTELVVDALTRGSDLETAMAEAQSLIERAMIEDSSPLTGLNGDRFLKRGDFTSPFPQDQSEAFARNRAISFSYLVRDLNLSAESAFDIIDLLVQDYKDGHADGITLDDGRDVNVSESFALSRTRLFQDTTERMGRGELSEAQLAELEMMGFDTEMFNDTREVDVTLLNELVTTYLASSTLPTLHRLPRISDEDGNAGDAKERYTLQATAGVDVTVETPEGSWVTPMWRYNNTPLPVLIKTSRGTEMTLNFENNLTADSTIHWHGFKIPAIMDGGPDLPVVPNTSKTYSFTMDQPAAPLWFHPHPDMQTGKQVYMGLAGVYILEDAISRSLEDTKQLPSGEKDTTLLVQDRRFTAEQEGVRELAYMSMEMDSDGMLGDTILVNGSVMPKQEVSDTLHRYRLYNVSNARNYDFALSDGGEFTIVATDGGLLNAPVSVDHIMLGAAQRVEIVVDFSKYSVGDKVMLVSKPFNGDMMNMMGNSGNSEAIQNHEDMQRMPDMQNMNDINNSMTSTQRVSIEGMLPNGTALGIMRFDISSAEVEDVTLYERLPETAEIATRLSEADASNRDNERAFTMSMEMSQDMENRDSSTMNMRFVINAKSFDMNRVDEFVEADATEIWSIKNISPMAHPFHAHAIQYQILTRNGVPASGVDLGWKDTFLVQPGETVRVIGDFSGAEGDYMYHCHILEHEDAGMMGYFRVGDTGNVGVQ